LLHTRVSWVKERRISNMSRQTFVSVAMLVVLLAKCQASYAQAPANLANYTKLEIMSNEKVAYKGQPVVVEFKLTNTSSIDVWLVEPLTYTLKIELYNGQGKELLSCLGDGDCRVSVSFYDLHKLAPGQSLSMVRAMAFEYPMKTPGTYTVRARYTMEADYEGRINGEFLNTKVPFAGTVSSELTVKILDLAPEMQKQFDKLTFTSILGPPETPWMKDQYVGDLCGGMFESDVLEVSKQHPEYYFAPYWLAWEALNKTGD
jgi:hypothetical protein